MNEIKYVLLQKIMYGMAVNRNTVTIILSLLIIMIFGYSYYFNYKECKNQLYADIDNILQTKANLWSSFILQDKGVSFSGRYNSFGYENKKNTIILIGDDTIDISSTFYHPESYSDYQLKNRESYLILTNRYDINLVDSLFESSLAEIGITTGTSISLKIKDLRKIFPVPDSMCHDVPFSEILASDSVDGYITNSVGIGICDHAQLYGHVKVDFLTILKKMHWFGINQISLFILLIIGVVCYQCIPIFLYFNKNILLIGNTCIDLPNRQLYLWSGECRHITDIRMALIKMIIDAAPSYKLSKEMVCRDIWNLDTKDAQARYDMAMKGMRTLFITEDVSLELKSLTGEGVQLLINDSLIKKGRKFHYLWIYLRNGLKNCLATT